MKKKELLSLAFASISCFTLTKQQTPKTSETVAQKQQTQLTQEQEQIIVVGSNFANIIFNALNVMANKDDIPTLQNSISNIMSSFVNIAVEASKGQTSDESIEEVVEAIKKFCDNLQEEDVKVIVKTIKKQIKL